MSVCEMRVSRQLQTLLVLLSSLLLSALPVVERSHSVSRKGSKVEQIFKVESSGP